MKGESPRGRAHGAAVKAKHRSVRGASSVSTRNPSAISPIPAAKSAFSGWTLWVSLALVAVNVVVYAPVWRHEFVNFDDFQYLSQNPHVLGGLTWRGVWWAFTTGYFSNWHPLTWLSYMLDVQLYGLSVGPHHLTNLLLHIANTLLLFGLLERITGALGRSAFVAALFAVHPLHVESVAWVAERKDVLSTLFGILTLWAYLAYVRKPRLARYLVMLLFFALGLMAKPMLVTLPFVLLLLDFWPLGRVRGWEQAPIENQFSGHDARAPNNWLRLVWEKIPLFALTMASSIVTFVVQRRSGAVSGLETFPLLLRAQNAAVSYIAYVGKMLWPARLAAYYPYPRSLPVWWVIGSLLGLLGVSFAVVWWGRRYPYLPVGWLWYLGTLTPVIGFVQVGKQSMADRYTYVPLIGLFIIAAWGVPDLLVRWPNWSTALPTAAALVILGFAIVARTQVRYWETSTSLWTHDLEATHDNYVAHNTLGMILAAHGKPNEAMAHYSAALQIKPDYADAHYNLGSILARQGKITEAMAHFSEALRINPEDADPHYILATLLAAQGKTNEAMAHFSEVLRIKPDDAEARHSLGVFLEGQGRLDEAIHEFSEALRTKPDYAEAHNDLGTALVARGRFDEGIHELSEALRIRPDYAEAHHVLGIVLAAQGRTAEAIEHYSAALRINSDFAEAHHNLALALAGQGKVNEAIAHYTEALRIKPSYAEAHTHLGVVLAAEGRFDEAARHLKTALQLKPNDSEARRALDDLMSRGRK